MLDMVISGGQTGVDQIGLKVARSLNIPTGGYAPKGWRTEFGSDPSLADYGLVESEFTDYNNRTRENVLAANATVIFGDVSSAGTAYTLRVLDKNRKPHLINPSAQQLADFIRMRDISVLNVAGNRGSKLTPLKMTEIEDTLRDALSICLAKAKQGQTQGAGS